MLISVIMTLMNREITMLENEVKIVVVDNATGKIKFTVPCGYLEADTLRDEVAHSYRKDNYRAYVDYGRTV